MWHESREADKATLPASLRVVHVTSQTVRLWERGIPMLRWLQSLSRCSARSSAKIRF